MFWEKRRCLWVAGIKDHGAHWYLGEFASEEDAALAYDLAACEVFGEFAKLNFNHGLDVAVDARREAIRDAGVLERLTRSERMVRRWRERQPVTRTCVWCSGEYESMSLRPSFYCSPACRARWRRQQERERQGRLF